MTGKWGSEQTIKFLEKYQELLCLWDFTHPNYKNKFARNQALQELVRYMGLPDFDTDAAKVKIHSLRVTYNHEKNKILKSKNSGCVKEEIYNPKLSWFPLADSFLNKMSDKKETFSNLEIQKEEDISISFKETKKEDVDGAAFAFQSMPVPSSSISSVSESDVESITQPLKRKRRKLDNYFNRLCALEELRSICQSKVEDECDLFTRHLASILRRLSEEDRLELQAKFLQMAVNKRLEILRRQ